MPFAEPLDVRDLSECFFYHTIDLPGVGVMHGEWDLRDGLDQYIGSVDVRGKRVLAVGSANGFVSFSLERNGATVVAYDLSPGEQWDLVPYGGILDEAYARERQLLLRRLNNAFWFAHRAFRSSARLAHGSVYAVAPSLGLFDVTIVGCILLHLRDPFLALQATLAQTTETAVVVDLLPPWYDSERAADGRKRSGSCRIPIGASRSRRGGRSLQRSSCDGWAYWDSVPRSYRSIASRRRRARPRSSPSWPIDQPPAA